MEHSERDCTVYVGRIDRRVTEEIIFELFLQAGPLEKVSIPKDKESGVNKNYGFVTFTSPISVAYAIDLLDGTALYGQKITVKPQTGSTTPVNTVNRGFGRQSPISPMPDMRGSPMLTGNAHQHIYNQNATNLALTSMMHSAVIKASYDQNNYGRHTPTNQYSPHYHHQGYSNTSRATRDSYQDERYGRHSSKRYHPHNRR